MVPYSTLSIELVTLTIITLQQYSSYSFFSYIIFWNDSGWFSLKVKLIEKIFLMWMLTTNGIGSLILFIQGEIFFIIDSCENNLNCWCLPCSERQRIEYLIQVKPLIHFPSPVSRITTSGILTPNLIWEFAIWKFKVETRSMTRTFLGNISKLDYISSWVWACATNASEIAFTVVSMSVHVWWAWLEIRNSAANNYEMKVKN